MKKFTLAAAFVLAGISGAMAQDMIDANEDGMITLDEVMAIYPDVTEDAFVQADTNSDGVLDVDELAAAQEAGILPSADDM
ncbi:MAG: hypothetical protein P8X43_04740 [Maritimibacter sp.]